MEKQNTERIQKLGCWDLEISSIWISIHQTCKQRWVSIYHLQGKASIWWDELVKLKDIDEDKITWKNFKKHFQKEYLSENYYDKKMEVFFELKSGSMTMESYEKRFL